MDSETKKVLLVEDDEDDFVVARDILAEIKGASFELEWAESYDAGLEAIARRAHDIYLFDYRLGCHTGLELLHQAIGMDCKAPIILLTGQDDRETDLEAMRAGAADYLVKGQITAQVLERSIRYAIERKRAEEQILHAAFYDHLTQLPNRLLFHDRLKNTIEMAARNRRTAAVLFLDLDNFKRINDTLGHRMGDLVLKSAAELLSDCLRKTDTVSRFKAELINPTVSRLGGDEFIILLPEISQCEDTILVAKRIMSAMVHPFSIEGHELFISASLGIAIYPIDGNDVDSLLKNADTAMYHAKSLGKNNFQFYEQRMNSAALEKLTLENNLHRGIERGEFLLHYQPQMNVQSGKIVGFEALVRWNHSERGMIQPNVFIPLAEETGLIVPIGEWVLEEACRQNKAWQDAGIPPFSMAVNISTHQLRHPAFVESVARVLHQTGLAPQHLSLEITESIMMENIATNMNTVTELKKMGLQFAIDDFGVGYSSFNYLRQLPIDTIKIDRSFLNDITTNPDDAAIVSAIIAMSHGLNLEVIAEGVETEEHRKFLWEQGCDMFQGFLLSKPMSAGDVEIFLKDHQIAPKNPSS